MSNTHVAKEDCKNEKGQGQLLVAENDIHYLWQMIRTSFGRTKELKALVHLPVE